MRQIIFHLILLMAVWILSHGLFADYIWQVYPIIWFILLINKQLNFLSFLFISFLFGFIADFEIISVSTDAQQGLFWGVSSVFLTIFGAIQRITTATLSFNIFYIGLTHELYRFMVKLSYTSTVPNWGNYILVLIFNLIFLLMVSTLVLIIQDRFNSKRSFT